MKLFFKYITKAWGVYKKSGLLEMLERVSAHSYFPNKLFCISSHYLLKLDHINERAISRTLKDYEFDIVEKSGLEELLGVSTGDPWMTDSRREYTKFFEKGSICFTAKHDNKIIGYLWGTSERYILNCNCGFSRRITISLKPGSVYLSNMYIDKSYRFKGLYGYTIYNFTKRYNNKTQFYTDISNLNKESLNSAFRLGFVKIRKIICLSLFGMRYLFSKDNEGRYIGGSSTIDLVL